MVNENNTLARLNGKAVVLYPELCTIPGAVMVRYINTNQYVVCTYAELKNF